MSSLLVTSGPLFGAHIPLSDEAFIGRLALCSIQLPSSQISRKHARIWKRDRYYFIEDLGSRNGTFLNDNSVTRTTRLTDGDVISVGDVSLVFEAEARLLSARYGAAWVLLSNSAAPEFLTEAALGRFEGDLGDLTALAHLLTATVEEEALVRGILQLLSDRLQCDEVVLLRRKPGRPLPSPLGVVAAAGPVPVHQGLYDHAVRSGRTASARGLVRTQLEGARLQAFEGTVHGLYTPLKLEDRVEGVLCCTRFDSELGFSSEEIGRVSAIASLFVPALDNARRHTLQRRRHRAWVEPQKSEGLLVGTSARSQRLMGEIRAAASVSEPVLFVGESGSGKERLARLIHAWSERWQGPMVSVSCQSLSESQLELLIFGRVGQSRDNAETRLERPVIGKAVLADGGTLYLDRVDTLPGSVQDRLLRLLQSGHVWRLGAVRSLSADTRIVASAEQELINDKGQPLLRPELVQLLSGRVISVPPLRERRSDMDSLIHELLLRVSIRLGRSVREVSADANTYLRSLDWPGNIRELEGVLTQAVSFCTGHLLSLEDVELAVSSGGELRLSDSLRGTERRILERALAVGGGRIADGARLLEVSPEDFERQLRELGIPLP